MLANASSSADGASAGKNPRIVRFLQDAQLFLSQAEKNKVEHAVIEETNLQFTLCLDGKEPIPCSIIASEVDYPHGTVLIVGNGSPDFVDLPIDKAFEKIVKDVTRKSTKTSLDSGLDLGVPDQDSRPASRNSEFMYDAYGDDEDAIDHLASVEIMHAHVELGSILSKFCPSGLDHADLYFEMQYSDVLSSVSMKAWGFPEKNSLKITLLNVYLVGYRAGNQDPLVKVELSKVKADETPPGILEQIKMIGKKYIRENFKLDTKVIDDKLFPKANFLVGFYDYIRARLNNLNEYCIICDKKLIFSLLMPCVCYGDLCTYSYGDLGLMAEVGTFATDPGVIDLLMAMLYHAANQSMGSRGSFEPFPSIADPHDPAKLILDPKSPDNDLLLKVLATLPEGKKLFEILGNSGALKEHHALAWPVIRWTLTSNRAYIVPLALDVQLPFMCTAYQFLMLTDSPAKEKAFRDAKKKSPKHVHYVFHGSPSFNWHSILRQGLLVGSKTVRKLHGSAHGEGIYLSPLSSISAGYSYMYGYNYARMSAGTPRQATADSTHLFDKVHNMTCIAICEVIGDKDKIKKHGSGEIWTLSDPEHCCTRFLFAYAGATNLNPSIDLRKKEYIDVLNKAMKHHNLL